MLNPELGQNGPGSVHRSGIFFPTNEPPRLTPLRAGYGRCGVNGCNCPAYGGNGNLCSNCGHNYSDHW